MSTLQDVQVLTRPEELRALSERELADRAVDLAAWLLAESHRQQTSTEKAQGNKIARMMEDPNGKTLTMQMCDQVFRSSSPERMTDQLNHLVERYGLPKYLAGWEQWGLWLGSTVGEYIPSVVAPFVASRLRAETRNVILSGEEEEFHEYVEKRRAEGTRLNLNQLGEAILGEEEAARRLAAYVQLLQREDVEYISVKISSVFSQIHLIAFEETVVRIQERLRELYRAAQRSHFRAADGRLLPKFVNLDMEEYRDLHLTAEAFMRTLDEEEFRALRAGIVLQAYLPDAHPMQQRLTNWALQRVHRGGASIKIRIVKGANLAMERVEASWHDWPQSPYVTKPEVDANYKRMVLYGCRPEHAHAVHLGIASHNLFDLAFGILLRAQRGLEAYVEFEMLEGMANHQARALRKASGGLLFYAPVVKREDFHSAIAYLVRRLDENTAPENFLHDVFGLEPGSAKWEKQKAAFLQSVDDRERVPVGPRRTQNRAAEYRSFDPAQPFHNEADTDWSLPANAQWMRSMAERWRDAPCRAVPLQIGGNELPGQRHADGFDPARPGHVPYRYALATMEEVEHALTAAVEAGKAWAAVEVAQRKQILVQCATSLARARGDLNACMMVDAGKTIAEADVELSEAIDFANYYGRAFDGVDFDGAVSVPMGVVLVAPPWNFPLSIPCGSTLAALMAGNAVILKPAPETVLTAWELCRALWAAGVPRSVLQFVPVTEDEVGKRLITDDRVNVVSLTGGYETAQMFLGWKPSLKLFAETSGKNAMIITAMADHDQAIRDLVRSAFGHAGQKCSAASLVVLEAEVYDNAAFLRQLRDAAQSLTVGACWDYASIVPPVIRQPGSNLLRGLTKLDAGEQWLLEPRCLNQQDNLWTPGIRLGVKPGSWFHRTECFGPVLGIMRAESLEDAIAIVNQSEFGLTSGLQSLDDREQKLWLEKVEAGNLYLNRGITGAIVRRQPFGGWKKSVFGEAKAGGPNAVFAFAHWTQQQPAQRKAKLDEKNSLLLQSLLDWLTDAVSPAAAATLERAAHSYAAAWKETFRVEHDPSQVLGEANLFRYRPVSKVLLRMESPADWVAGAQVMMAASICGAPIELSVSSDATPGARFPVGDFAVEADREWAHRTAHAERVRLLHRPAEQTLKLAHAAHARIVDEPVLESGRMELRHYLREQSVTITRHRYGNLLA
jgi:RHH-type transcriptional regulator, proline utilization regulon repressor / proline dehydrogenase / delta 1-pyrroline-5-carboxylate dehydrogenase